MSHDRQGRLDIPIGFTAEHRMRLEQRKAEILRDAQAARDQWAERLVQQAAFMHVDANQSCRGYTIASSGRTFCGRCDWALSGRLDDVGELRSARFALYVLAAIGLVIGVAATEQPE